MCVCVSNICLIPTAHSVFCYKLNELGLEHFITVNSAGIHNYHSYSPLDECAQDHAAKLRKLCITLAPVCLQ